MKSYQLKVAKKKMKPPIWKRCLIPSGLSFSQLSVLLNEIVEEKSRPAYVFEFYQKGLRIGEKGGAQVMGSSWRYDLADASKTWIDELLEQEEWFSYTLESGVSYRVTIENVTMEGTPYPMILKSKGSQSETEESDVERQNAYLKEKFYVSYGNPQPMSQEKIYEYFDAGNVDMLGNLHPINNSADIMKGPFSVLQDFVKILGGEADVPEPMENAVKGEARSVHEIYAEINETSNRIQAFEERFWSCMTPEEKEKLTRPRGVTLEVALGDYLKSDLVEFAKDLHLLKISGLNKAELAKRIADYLLSPLIMREKLCTIDDDAIALFEKIAGSETLYQMDEHELWMAEELIGMDYIIQSRRNMVEVPIDVREAYECINTTEFQHERRTIVWMLKCLYVARELYVVTPMRILRKIFRKNSMFKAEADQLTEIFEMVPKDKNPCVKIEERIVDKRTVENSLYQRIEDMQGDKDFYIPTREEIEDLAEHGYFSKAPGYEKLYWFLRHSMKIGERETNDLVREIYKTVYMGDGFQEVLDELDAWGIGFSDVESLQQFADIMMEVNNNTRMFRHRGFTPNEMTERMKDTYGMSGVAPTIVPTSTMAANMLREGEEEIRRRGFELDFDSYADEIPVTVFPNGINGTSQTQNKKIYPNDPCPCGSGKKYKKCCGRK